MTELPKKRYSAEFLKFYEWASKLLKENNKTLKIKNAKFIYNEGRCGGFCDESGIVLAGQARNFEQNFVHEVAHMIQILEKSPLWTEENWWDGKFDLPHFLKILNLLKLELDCEKRVLKLNKKWKMFDEDQYCRESNAYLYSYHYMFLKQNWNMSSNFYNKNIFSLMPSKLIPEYKLRIIDMALMVQFENALLL